jgi:hypothetical protein
MSHLRLTKWYAGGLLAWTAGWALPAQAQFYDSEITDTFGGNPGTNAFIRIPKDTDDWTRHFRLGAMVGMNISAKFGMTGSFGVSGNNPAAGKFDDGYVYPDQSGDPTHTGYWGYNNASQLSGNTLTMHAITSFSTGAAESQSDGGFQPGLDVAYGDNLWYWRHARVGWELGFGWLPINITSTINHEPVYVSQSVYTFNTGGIVVPGAPYQGGPSGVGEPIIAYPANGFTPSSTTNSASGTLSGTHTLDATLYTLRLGPSFYWDLSRRFSLDLAAGPAVGLVTGAYKYNEVITTASGGTPNSGEVSGLDVVYGGYVNGTFLYHLKNDADVYLGAQFMPMTDATFSGSGRTGRLDLGGQLYFSLGFNWAF